MKRINADRGVFKASGPLSLPTRQCLAGLAREEVNMAVIVTFLGRLETALLRPCNYPI